MGTPGLRILSKILTELQPYSAMHIFLGHANPAHVVAENDGRSRSRPYMTALQYGHCFCCGSRVLGAHSRRPSQGRFFRGPTAGASAATPYPAGGRAGAPRAARASTDGLRSGAGRSLAAESREHGA